MPMDVVPILFVALLATELCITNSQEYLEQPVVVESEGKRLQLELSVATHRVNLGQAKFTTRAFQYDGIASVPGPTIKVKAGDTLEITLKNAISAESGSDYDSYSSMSSDSSDSWGSDFLSMDSFSSSEDIDVGDLPGLVPNFGRPMPGATATPVPDSIIAPGNRPRPLPGLSTGSQAGLSPRNSPSTTTKPGSITDAGLHNFTEQSNAGPDQFDPSNLGRNLDRAETVDDAENRTSNPLADGFGRVPVGQRDRLEDDPPVRPTPLTDDVLPMGRPAIPNFGTRSPGDGSQMARPALDSRDFHRRSNVSLPDDSPFRHLIRRQVLQDQTPVVSPHVVNLYTHGLHIDPAADSMTIGVPPGHSYTYTIAIPPDHAPGLNWYSSHYHGTSAYHLALGLAGAILVEPANPYAVPQELRDMESIVMVLQYFNLEQLPPFKCQMGRDSSAFPDIQLEQHVSRCGDDLNLDVLLQPTSNRKFVTVNGQSSPMIMMRNVEKKVFRFLNAGPTKFLELELPGCDMHLIARDGVYRSQPSEVEVVVLPPGSRADVIVSCQSQGSFPLKSVASPSRDNIFKAENSALRYEQDQILTVVVTAANQAVMPLPSFLPELPAYLTDPQDLFVEEGYSPAKADYGLRCSSSLHTCKNTFNDMLFSEVRDYTRRIQSGTTEEWFLSSPGLLHPLHAHAHHFRVIYANEATSTGDGVLYEVGEWRDVLPIDGNMTVRLQFDRNFHGPLVIHNNFLINEDQGMLQVMLVYPPLTQQDGSSEDGAEKVTSTANISQKPPLLFFIVCIIVCSSELR
ncbi:multicopper oxidase CueO-like [Ptychodera flava]|uniref:multicopper oxidase CueO-like n=1 Tax=Ptychodera flava TaxID=63121 RepID=UPI00396A8EBE